MTLLNYLTKIKIFKRIIPSIVKRILKLFRKNIFIYEFDNLKLNINLNEPMDQLIFFHNEYEKEQINFLTTNIKNHNPNIFIDVGANSGIYSLQVGKSFPNLKIVSFEPVKETFLKFEKNILLNKNITNITPYSFGLSDENQSLKMKALKKNGYIQQGGFGVAGANENTSFLHTEFASFKKGDEQFNIKNNIAFIKIDVEGHELNVLYGIKKLIKNNNIFMQIEIFDRLFENTNDFLIKNNFKVLHKIFSDGKTDYYYKNF
jgi:FkbM family methyltransferase|tara:strand:- start:27 stop:809 length:783 start_codon:yes stop_codon:yes gene_type:complete